MRRIRVQDLAAYQSPGDTLPQDLIENLLGDVVVPEPTDTVDADGGMVGPFFRQPQPQKPSSQ